MYNSFYLPGIVHITYIIPIYSQCMICFIFKIKIKPIRINKPYNIYVVIFITILTNSIIIKIYDFSFSKLSFCINR